MDDLIEVQYWVAEAKTQRDEIAEILKSNEKIEDELRNQLAEAQTVIASQRQVVSNLDDVIAQGESLLPKLLTELDAVAELKKGARLNQFTPALTRHKTESKAEHERMQKALFTLGATYEPENKKVDGEYVIEIYEFPESYAEFAGTSTITQ